MQQFILAYLALVCELLKSRDCFCLCVLCCIWPLKLWYWVGRIGVAVTKITAQKAQA